MRTKPKTKVKPRVEKTIVKGNYEYHLVECGDREQSEHPTGCFMGQSNMVLKSCKKIK